ncbi:MAG: hypothetical protein AVDCRST_MAG36-2345 [uncultured Nocardioidaceae bacterium]|uniref:Copper transporter n=1 Tax=uncultured Nocardioidaceae bacterium TaxID=253824 RepID=A0A6J4MFL7_9ACTN|nr:MAG: hypothetical protein AVDCRST_MAG36-2345 [uncultured Nocardioidaceae bacterium]
MSPRRDRVVTTSTVLLALAAGVFLGAGPLQGGSSTADAGGDPAALQDARAEVEALQRARGYDDAYLRATAPQVLGDALAGRTVTVVVLPGADTARVAELTELVGVAGGTVSMAAEVRPELLDVGNRQLVAELARQTQEAARTPVDVPEGTVGYDLAAQLLGRALVDPEDAGAPGDRTGEGVLASFATAGLVTTAEPVTRRGSLALLVAGAPTGSPDDRQGAGTITATLAQGLAAAADGAVLAGPAAAGAADGAVGTLRAGPARQDVSTVDAVDSLAGSVVAVQALAAEARGRTGHYGSSAAADGVLPR